ncbi:FAD-containing oxidoreductase [Oceanicella sp. SM1341]|uniref:FAD-containing oxidoreductase n=1 Tax=Oceanicella sp. SM1341 TaxID=1548889 RepID=UPI000E54DD8B|nr:FAD-containing oxidoreductase [Oceanicella sp. SM1341]
MEEFDAIIIGTGQAAPPLAARLSAQGQRVAVIERKLVGGTCVNAGCTPTKALVASAKVAQTLRRSAEYGVEGAPPRIDMPAVTARLQGIAARSRTGVESWLEGMEGVSLIRGQARLDGPGRVAVGPRRLAAPRIFLNVGARPALPDLPGRDTVPVLTSTDMLALRQVPEHLVVVGGSYIGLEFAQAFRRLGAAVTVVERGAALLGREDPEVSGAIREILEEEGIAVHTGAECISLAAAPSGVRVSLGGEGPGAREVVGSDLLLAVGRVANTDDLGLETVGITPGARGMIEVNDRLETGVPGLWALGDCNGRGAFTHTSWNDHEIVVANLLEGGDRRVSDRIPCYGLFIDPPLGRVGLTETAARAAGHDVLVSSRPMSRVARAVEKGEARGVMKVVAEAGSGRVLGAAILGPGGDEAIHALIDAMQGGLTRETLQWAVPVHPTVAELIPTLLGTLAPAGEAAGA